MMNPSHEEAFQFALMITAGVPSREAIRWFVSETDPLEIAAQHDAWMRDRAVRREVIKIQGGKAWQDLSLDEKISLSINKHYAEMAYFLYSRNYCELQGAEKAKADTCRSALEAKLAGQAGKMDALSQFYAAMAAKGSPAIRAS